jgi:hypothetical protein
MVHVDDTRIYLRASKANALNKSPMGRPRTRWRKSTQIKEELFMAGQRMLVETLSKRTMMKVSVYDDYDGVYGDGHQSLYVVHG